MKLLGHEAPTVDKDYCFRFKESGTGTIFFQIILTFCSQDLDHIFFSLYIVIGSQNESQPIYSNPRPQIVYLVGVGSPCRVCILALPHLLHNPVLLEVSSQRCRNVCIHIWSCEESSLVAQVSKVHHQLHLIEVHVCICLPSLHCP